MQDEQQYQQLKMQYEQLKNGAEYISKLIDSENYDSAITMIKSREAVFLNCKSMRNYLELTPVQKNELDKLLDELRDLELKNIKKLEDNMKLVQAELTKSQKSQKIQQAYNTSEETSGSMINFEE